MSVLLIECTKLVLLILNSLILGGGLSFLSTQYGWAANSIVEYEIVLANASIVTASQSHNADLWKALKGGINNYGIVTAYTMKAYPQGQIWGGNIIYSADQTSEILAAVRDFTEYYPDDKAGIVSTIASASCTRLPFSCVGTRCSITWEQD